MRGQVPAAMLSRRDSAIPPGGQKPAAGVRHVDGEAAALSSFPSTDSWSSSSTLTRGRADTLRQGQFDARVQSAPKRRRLGLAGLREERP